MDATLLDQIHVTGKVRDRAGNETDVRRTSMDRSESDFLSDLIAADPTIRRTLEIGCAYGVASLCICQSLAGREDVRHTILDPFQTTIWKRVGINLLEQAGCDFFEFLEEPSEIAMPRLLAEHTGAFDLIFIDGYHTFDHTLLDLFYATRLLRVGGYVVVDDTNWASVAKAVSYFLNYPAYQMWGQSAPRSTLSRVYRSLLWTLFPPAVAGWILPRIAYDRIYARQLFTGMTALQKIAPDKRKHDWFTSF